MNLFWLVPVGSMIALGFSFYLIIWIFKKDSGSEEMRKISGFVSTGAKAYLKQQYKVVSIFFLVLFFILLFMAYKGFLVIFVPFAFLTGGFWSALCGWIGMWIATNSSSRTAQGCRESLNQGLRVAFSSGTVMGLMVVGLGLLDLAIWYFILNWWYSFHPLPAGFDKLSAITSTMLCFGMGASAYALFARVGGGIYTKAADVGADLVGKVEEGLPEDDPRNPAVIADQVGDNVGDVAGMGADLYESYVDSIVATMALAAGAGLGIKGVTIPLLIAVCGVIASVLGFFFVKTKRETQKDLILSLRRGVYSASLLIAIFSYLVVVNTLGKSYLGVWGSVIVGLIVGIFLGVSTEYFTSHSFSPTRQLSQTALTGPATVIIGGLSLGMFSTLIPVVLVCLGVLMSFYLSGGRVNYNLGLYGVGVAAVGLLSTLGITLASDAYGPVADNAGGNAQMAGLPSEVRKRTDQLDALGNTTAATGKGFAIGSASLTALALIVAYKERVELLGRPLELSLLNPRLLVGLFIGGMSPFIFSSSLLKSVGRTASKIIEEVRRQFREDPLLKEGKSSADYESCVRITLKAAQKEMLLPALLAILLPVIVGLLLGIEAVASLLVGALVSGFVLALMMANSGGAWDNAKKFIEEGNFGGKGSSAHKASVVGDTVGDPFKDTAGPSLNILIKLMSMVSIVFSGFIIKFSLFK
ncbi:MAG TPA: sodium-translocating pyrophosphatase [Candidatus Omnitrophica bacterium]|nr:MAG: sodium-translocating pyrophosphatase [Candidatus Omnitrophota bacterium]RKY35673.1 MAG: sodium-translocating pyrophosphatase [Candidatus Omnitrophota bacterium]RKY44981.1 MAG: sodium-translocating pyrophosphatase [Candidatus Omnitrophota bacterium]HEC69805.1 sodium-translocating pyrophosphatase [Candidatus Omnitrophota bacterium]